jgi:hypothetical protein
MCADSCSNTKHNCVGNLCLNLEGARQICEDCNFSVQVRNEHEADEPVPLVDAKIAVLCGHHPNC